MPLIKYLCSDQSCSHAFSSFFVSAIKAPDVTKCKKCDKEAKRCLSAPSSMSKITVDNGLQPRATEVHRDIMELREEWTNRKNNRGD